MLTERNIARNPSEIEITRVESRIDDDGGREEVRISLPPQTMRIFLSTVQAQDIVQEGGQLQIQRWGLLAGRNADIQNGDEFTYGGQRFRVRSVLPVSRGGEPTGYHADLEEVR